MPIRATRRGAERTPLDRDADVLICGASFAGLAVARALAGSSARVLMIDRYEIGERQTSACGVPTGWFEALDLPWQQTFSELVVHTPNRISRIPLPWKFSTFDYWTVCQRLAEQGGVELEIAKVERREGDTVLTDRGPLRAPLIVDGLGWRRILGPGENVQPPEAFLSRGLEVHPGGSGQDLAIWIDSSYVPAGYGWSFPAGDEVRVGIGSFDPRFHVREPTVRLAQDTGRDSVRFQGNWIPHRIRPAAEDGVFFVGDSAGHCIPLTAEGIRTALYFGLAAGREIRRVLERAQTREQALTRYGAFSAAHRWKFEAMLGWQRAIPRMPVGVLERLMRLMERPRVAAWNFEHYLNLAHPRAATGSVAPAASRSARPRVLAA